MGGPLGRFRRPAESLVGRAGEVGACPFDLPVRFLPQWGEGLREGLVPTSGRTAL